MRKVLALCLLMCFVFALTAWALDDMGKSTTVNGWVADDKCGAKGANAGAEACTKKCLAAGAKMVVVTDGDQKVLLVDNPDALKGHEGHHVAVTGQVGKDSIHVESAKML
jgi:sugar/nucleoside kinase (ribokinase family)